MNLRTPRSSRREQTQREFFSPCSVPTGPQRAPGPSKTTWDEKPVSGKVSGPPGADVATKKHDVRCLGRRGPEERAAKQKRATRCGNKQSRRKAGGTTRRNRRVVQGQQAGALLYQGPDTTAEATWRKFGGRSEGRPRSERVKSSAARRMRNPVRPDARGRRVAEVSQRQTFQ